MPAKRATRQQRQQIIKRANGYCEYCRCPDSFTSDPFSVDHIVPLAKGGRTVLKNLAYACQGCNGKKQARIQAIDPFTFESAGLFHPRQQKWVDHFAWNEDFSLAIGLTSCGRATIEALGLNRKGVVNLRRLLKDSQLHPPGAQPAFCPPA